MSDAPGSLGGSQRALTLVVLNIKIEIKFRWIYSSNPKSVACPEHGGPSRHSAQLGHRGGVVGLVATYP